jgi:hypothetical protein
MAGGSMDFGNRVRSLGAVDAAPLRDRILTQPPEAWTEFGLRQRAYDVHHDTESIVLVFCDEAWPDVTVSRQPGWDRLADLAIPLMHEVIARAYPKGGTILRAMAAKLKAGGRIKPHIDALASFRAGHRIHVPLTTNPGVRFTLDGRPLPMVLGEACEINNQKVHSVMNAGREDRISFIFDYLPPEA